MLTAMEARAVPTDCPFWERGVTLARFKDGRIEFVTSKAEKEAWLAQATVDMNAGTVYFIAWTGRWTTDLFSVTALDVDRFMELRREDRLGQERNRKPKSK